MIISDDQANIYLHSLYYIAEKDMNDVIANSASTLAVRLEKMQRTHHLTKEDILLLRYAFKNAPVGVGSTITQPRRKTYKRRYHEG